VPKIKCLSLLNTGIVQRILKAKKAYCACAVLRDLGVGVRSNHIFGIPDHDLSIHYTTTFIYIHLLFTVNGRQIQNKTTKKHIGGSGDD